MTARPAALLRHLAAVVAAGAAAVMLLAPPARAAGEPQTGVWSQAPVPATTSIPEGGLWLRTSPAGDTASSAVRFAVAGSEVATKLRLKIAGSRAVPGVRVALCATKGSWKPPASRPGPWADRAVPDCQARLIEGVLSPTGDALDFSFVDYGPGDDVDLVLTRRPDDAQTTEDLTFAKPAAADLTTVSTAAGAGPSPAPATGGSGGAGSPPQPVGGSAPAPSGGTEPFAFTGGGVGGALSPPAAPPADLGPAGGPAAASALDAVEAAPRRTGAVAARSRGRDGAWWAALAGFAVCAVWIAAILSRRVAGDGPAAAGFTLYRGAPPDRG